MDVGSEYRRNVGALLRFATALVGPDDAPDVVSEAVTSTLASERLAEVDDVRAYWFRAVANRSASWHRSTGRRRRREGRSAGVAVVTDSMTGDEARSLLAGLSPQQRAVVYLTYWHDWDPAAVGEALAVTEGTVRKQLARAREHLREVMRRERG